MNIPWHYKTCIDCLRELPVSQFYKHPGMKGGRQSSCQSCVKQKSKERYLSEKSRVYPRDIE